jgi:hypothetical protein
MPRAYRRLEKITPEQIIAWKENVWVVFEEDKVYKKKFSVRVGERDYRVTHGDEIIYEGWRLRMATRYYNKINKPPKEEDAPKTSN